jgi:predicted cupin superfamily sugar epimerase
MTPEELIKILDLVPHPAEGGFFVETYRAKEGMAAADLPSRYGARRDFGTAIYYLLTPETFSALHLLQSDEIFHFYLGDPVEMLHLYPHGEGKKVMLGPDIKAGMRPQIVVPQGIWQGARLAPGGSFALLGCTVAPGFDFADYAHGNRAELQTGWPKFREEIALLTTA